MNYRHAFHAGNFADILKHAVLVRLVDYLRRKDKPFVVIDTHAGAGEYDLSDGESLRTGEYRQGIARLLAAADAPAELAPYLAAVRGLNAGDAVPRFYPGSPRLVRTLLRPADRLVVVELHPVDAERLASFFVGDRQAKVYRLDGYLALKSFLPPKERRGLVLVDPPFETADELDRVAAGQRDALRRWPTGIYAVWYPTKDRAGVDALLASLGALAPGRLLAAEISVGETARTGALAGCGMAVLNPPYVLADEMERLLPWLAELLAQGPGACCRLYRPGQTRDRVTTIA